MSRRNCLPTVLLFLAVLPSISAQDSPELDTKVLARAGIPTDTAGLLQYFRLRSLKDGDRAFLQDQVAKLASPNFLERDKATRELTLRGTLAIPFLKEGSKDAPLEMVRRLELILNKIRDSQGPEQPVAAARLLAHRQVPEAAAVLLQYLPYCNEEYVEEEVLACVGRLALRGSRIDPALAAAVKDSLPERRAAAAYILGRSGGLEHRSLVRSFLSDADPLVRERAAAGLVGKRLPSTLRESRNADQELVRSQKIGIGEPDLVAFLKKRTLGEEDQRRLQGLVNELGSESFAVRSRASRLLIKEGTPALAFLKPALDSANPEVARRAHLAIEDIRRGPGPALPAAVVRLLALPDAAKSGMVGEIVRTLLAYVPFADDETVEEEAFNSLVMLSTRETEIDSLLPQALREEMPARRAAAAFVLGKVGLSYHLDGLRKLLDDPAYSVRYRAVQGLLAAQDRQAVPRLIALLEEAPAGDLWKVEQKLHRLAGEQAPRETVADASPAGRKKLAGAWNRWWQTHATSVDLARLHDGGAYLGLLTVCEYDSAVGRPGGRVWESPREGKERFAITGVLGAMDAQVLSNGRILVAENSGNRVTERDLAGNVHWEYRTPSNPVVCQRLPNGNTFIATYNMVMEVTPDRQVVYQRQRGPAFYIFSAQKLRNGHVVAMTAQGVIQEFDPVADKDIRTINLGPNGGWCSVEALANGRYLVATMNNGTVREIDAAGNTKSTFTYPGVFRATRLPDGSTLVASMTTRKVAIFDRSGALKWEKQCQGRPWSVRYR